MEKIVNQHKSNTERNFKMIYRDFKDKKLSLLGMGNMRLPTKEENGADVIDWEKGREIIDYAYNHGINYFDTAFRYHGGESELFIGDALSHYPRDTWNLASKFPGHMMKFEDHKLGFKGYLSNFHCDAPADIFNEQLEKCKVDHFDFYLLHNVCESSYDFYTNEELNVVEYFKQMREAGKITHLGFSAHGRAETIDAFLTKYEGVFEFVQIQLNYLDAKLQDAMSKYKVIFEKHGVSVVVMEPVRGGRLINLPESSLNKLKAAAPDASAASWAFRYFQNLPGVMVVLSGMTQMEQIVENVEIFSNENPLTDDELNTLDEIVNDMLKLVPCTGCRYCTEECPMGIDIPKLIAIYNEEKNEGSMLAFNMDTEKDSENPARCVGCGACSGICPQNIDVPSIMRDFAEIIEKKKS